MAFPYTRTSEYTEEVATAFCAGIAEGKSVRTICEDESMPSTFTIMKWLAKNPPFALQYARARETRAHARFESIDAVLEDLRAGTIDPNAARVIIDAIKWQCGKENAKKYGDRLELSGDAANPLTIAVRYQDQVQSAEPKQIDGPIIDV